MPLPGPQVSTSINALHIINDSTAVALGYRITKTDLPDADSPHHVVSVTLESMSESVSVQVTFSKGQLQVVKGTGMGHDWHYLGGRDIDRAFKLQHFAMKFKGKYKIDVQSSAKAIPSTASY